MKKLVGLGLDVVIEAGAGEAARLPDGVFKDAGATIASDEPEALKDADIVLKVRQPLSDEMALMKKVPCLWVSCRLMAIAKAFRPMPMRALMPLRWSLCRASLAPRAWMYCPLSPIWRVTKRSSTQRRPTGARCPMMMTAAGSIAPARVFILGAGVAGLQAIATAKRLGAIVSATDVPPCVKEQVESLGGTFVMVESSEADEAETAGGYAKEMSEDYKRRQAELVADHIAKQDIVICTALIPGKQAPRLVNEDMVKSMSPGSIVVDLAVEQGGNCAFPNLAKLLMWMVCLSWGTSTCPAVWRQTLPHFTPKPSQLFDPADQRRWLGTQH